jgi:Flp pilus assembly protein TadD
MTIEPSSFFRKSLDGPLVPPSPSGKGKGEGHIKLKSFLTLAILLIGLAPPVMAQPAHVYRANATTLHLQGQGLIRDHRPLDAIRVLQEAARINPFATQTASIYNTLGLAYRQVKRPELAMVSFMFATRLQPNFGPYYDNLVATWQDSDRLLDARQQLEDVTAASPDDGMAWYLLGLVAHAQLDLDMQQIAWQNFVQLEPNNPLRKGVCSQINGC